MALLRYVFYGALAGGPFALLAYQRLAHTYPQDPLNWEGNHGPWWNGEEQGYLVLNFVVFLCVCLGESIATLRIWRSDAHFTTPVRRGCGVSLLLWCALLIQLFVMAGALD